MRTDIIHGLVNDFADELGYEFLSFDVNQDDMCAYHFVDLVSFDVSYYNPKVFEKFKAELKNWYEANNYHFDIHIGTFGLLHEMGHLIATAELEEGELEEMISKNNFAKDYIDDEDLQSYKMLPMEQDADRIAYEIYTKHTDLVKQLDEAILKEVRRNDNY